MNSSYSPFNKSVFAGEDTEERKERNQSLSSADAGDKSENLMAVDLKHLFKGFFYRYMKRAVISKHLD